VGGVYQPDDAVLHQISDIDGVRHRRRHASGQGFHVGDSRDDTAILGGGHGLGAHFVFAPVNAGDGPAMPAVSQAWYRFRHTGKSNGTRVVRDLSKLFFFSYLARNKVGERMGKLAGVPPVRRQFIDDNGNYRQ
jgi:hypothetical protein